ncbi:MULTISPECIES: hypothetical protein [Cyanophyceae]|jgi:hypothetical protein|uniref:hypothetical protein n=1 Tax=Cyanophyceae TaxID=3028117 RepID=UPI00016DCE1D|nr:MULTISPECIES: hypothetical protein [Cyanophyceae]ACB00571.1 hypothetical protein SYNPCC7002_A2594 [Picosynechococcus sp. PCC 7002]SMH50452.1 hypothetical protein SAMN06272755_2216 [Picosynechococcus sp. OG1]SMQ81828.1 hypothetical protein SAMN06272774_1492 [Synechococcus sp. 7002]
MKSQNVFSTKSAKLIVGGTIFVSAITAANFTMLSAYAVDDTASFSGTVAPACALSNDDGAVAFDAGDRTYTATGSGVDVTELSETQYVDFECNTDTATVAIAAPVTSKPMAPTNASGLVATHVAKYAVDDTDTLVNPDPTSGTIINEATGVAGFSQAVNATGLFRVGVESKWSGANGMLAGDYSADITVTVTPN